MGRIMILQWKSPTFCSGLSRGRAVLGDGVGGRDLGLYRRCGGVGRVVCLSALVVSLGDRAVCGVGHVDLGRGDMAVSAVSMSLVPATDIGGQSRRGESNE